MKTIKNSKELAKLVDENKDLHLEGQDVRIEFQFTKEELRDVYCNDLFLTNDDEMFDFSGGNFTGNNFNGWDFDGRDFNGWDFDGRDFNGRDFNGGDFNGWDFNGRDFNGWDFNGRDFSGGNFTGNNFNGGDFNGRDFTGRNFNGSNFTGNNFNGRDFDGKKVSYWAFFICYGSIKCESIEGGRENHAEPICLDGKLEIKQDNVALEAINLLEEKGYRIVKK